MPDLEIKVPMPEPETPEPLTIASEKSSDLLPMEVGKLTEKVASLEMKVTEATMKAETAGTIANAVQEQASVARDVAETVKAEPEPEPVTVVDVPVILDEPVQPPVKKRGLLLTMFLGQ